MAVGNDGEVDCMPYEILELVKSYQFTNMLQHQKKNGTNSASSGLLPIIHQPTTSVA
ncbi:hypothetical protein RND71_023460 [Anisodus tanguticus]|uniref:Uncharacterized protein n=1 Tax=Anisodus tanguticus TaxID=243964 RepID=A0AAE1VES3_9SOLA|nr:hypothetical protein RND71_023460 [Anisodus tanguticus]